MRQKENLGYEQRDRNGKIFKVLPDKLKRELVSKIESGEISIEEVMREHNIRHHSNINSWLIKFGKHKDKYLSQKREHLAPQQKIKIISEYNPEKQTIKQYCEEVGIATTTFRRWENLYSCNSNKTRTVKMRPVSEKSIKKISEDNEEFIKELEEARLKIAGLETMINLAEKELNVSIRKKYGTKQ